MSLQYGVPIVDIDFTLQLTQAAQHVIDSNGNCQMDKVQEASLSAKAEHIAKLQHLVTIVTASEQQSCELQQVLRDKGVQHTPIVLDLAQFLDSMEVQLDLLALSDEPFMPQLHLEPQQQQQPVILLGPLEDEDMKSFSSACDSTKCSMLAGQAWTCQVDRAALAPTEDKMVTAVQARLTACIADALMTQYAALDLGPMLEDLLKLTPSELQTLAAQIDTAVASGSTQVMQPKAPVTAKLPSTELVTT